jgi:hypothetical protein
MNFSRLWHLLTTSRYTRSLEKRIEALEAAMLSMASPQPVPQGDPAAVDLGVGTGTVSTPPKPFQIKRSWRLEKIELERQHNQREEKGKRLAKNLKELPPKLYQ